MSSPPHSFVATSPLSPSTARNRRLRSKFTYKQLSLLASYSPTCPLRCIAHIDLDAFYAQCEMVRLNVPADQPLAVQQWQGLIAINYPARAFGLSRHVTIEEARQKCPDIICQHVATWKEGEDCWAYRDDAYKNMGTHKVSLDPYRLESRKILATIKETLPDGSLQRVEKASVDEVFLDLSAHIHKLLLDRYPELRGPAPYDDPTERLPAPPTSALDWGATDALVDLDAGEAEEDSPDWDDVAMLLGAEIVRGVRAAIRAKLHYTCSAGVARNKMLAKLGSGHKKPNAQTVVRNRAVARFLSGFKVTKIRNLGGKLGDEVVGLFNSDSIETLLQISQETLMKKLGDDTGAWLYHTLRGTDPSEVTPRTAIKSMLSAKSFRPAINTMEQATRWLRIFSADIFNRLRDDGVLEHRRRPRTLNLHHRQGGATRSRSAPIPPGRDISCAGLFALARDLLAQVVVDGRAWPCANLSLSVAGFEDGPVGTRGIGAFLVKGADARALSARETGADTGGARPEGENEGRPAKRPRTDSNARINAFFAKQDAHDPGEPADFDDVPSAQTAPDSTISDEDEVHAEREDMAVAADQTRCARCSAVLAASETAEHADWHMARDVQREDKRAARRAADAARQRAAHDQQRARQAERAAQSRKPGRGRGRPPGSSSSSAAERGQMKLTFG